MNRRPIAVLALAGLILVLPSPSSAAQAQRSFPVGAFDKVEAIGPHRVIVSVGGTRSVSAEGDADSLDKMEAVVRDGVLKIQPREPYRRNFSWTDRPRATFRITVPRLSQVALTGSGAMTIDRVSADRFAAVVAGSGAMRIDSLQVDQASISVAGSGDLTVGGRARSADISVAGSGTLHGRALSAGAAAVSVAGSGNAALSARDTADVSVVGSGRVAIDGSPRCSVSRIGSGKVRCGA